MDSPAPLATDPHATALAAADAALAAAAARAAADPGRPRSHVLPPGNWMNDPNGTIRHAGWYHLFYQLHPYGDQWGSMHWGHARSRDLAHWEHLPVALAPDHAHGEKHCFSGCIAPDADGTPRLLYTSIGDDRPSAQWRASPTDGDLRAWRRDRRPALDVAGLVHDARDPYVFHWRRRTFLLLGDGPRVALYEADGGDLDRLRPCGDLFRERPEVLPFCECPNLLPLAGADGDDWLLLLSPFRAVEWRRGRFDGGRLHVTALGRLDHHDHFYATNTLTDEAGRVVVLGWIRGFAAGKGWAGCLAHPRLVLADGPHGIRQQPHPAVELLRHGDPLRWRGTVRGQVEVGTAWKAEAGEALDCRLRLSRPGALHLAGHRIAWDGAFLHLAGAAYPLATASLDLRVLADRVVVEVFADDGRLVVTRTCPDLTLDGRVALAAEDAEAEIAVHRLGPCMMT